MNNNFAREQFKIKFKCSVCGESLKFTTNDIKTQCHSAYDVYIEKSVEPCPGCISKAQEPLKKLKEAIELSKEFKA